MAANPAPARQPARPAASNPFADHGLQRAPLMREIGAAADYLRFVRREIAALGSNELAKDQIPAALREIDYIIATSEDFSNAIMSAAEDVMAAQTSDPQAYRAYVAEKMTAIIVHCAFQDLTAQRATRVRTTLSTLERRLSRIASMIASRDVPSIVDFEPGRETGVIGPAPPGEGNDQARIDALLASVPTGPEPDPRA
jgi:chemotaxis protein CheZ